MSTSPTLSKTYCGPYRKGSEVLAKTRGKAFMRLDEYFAMIPGCLEAATSRSPLTKKLSPALGRMAHPALLGDCDLLKVA